MPGRGNVRPGLQTNPSSGRLNGGEGSGCEYSCDSRFDLFLIRNFFEPATCERVLDEMRSAPSAAATVYRDEAVGIVDARVRRVSRLSLKRETVELVMRLLLGQKNAVEEHFGISLKGCEEPQFLRYGIGDFFVAHQDGNTGLIRSQQEEFRKISVSIFLNTESVFPEPGTYCGGTLVFHRLGRDSYGLHGEAGTLVAFRAETTHEVIPVTLGERYAIACWFG